ncbi:uncharacterized protein LOC119698574 [Motacilla alba alba]|uniref:uncharacterized protein LOC119698574 n=1 Tax=Motacilla alba alba TaxID=1094192 RepID=UPI0018D52925|nr:uncharacterized protein LOC119698574 [Motacilla alba alba]
MAWALPGKKSREAELGEDSESTEEPSCRTSRLQMSSHQTRFHATCMRPFCSQLSWTTRETTPRAFATCAFHSGKGTKSTDRSLADLLEFPSSLLMVLAKNILLSPVTTRRLATRWSQVPHSISYWEQKDFPYPGEERSVFREQDFAPGSLPGIMGVLDDLERPHHIVWTDTCQSRFRKLERSGWMPLPVQRQKSGGWLRLAAVP